MEISKERGLNISERVLSYLQDNGNLHDSKVYIAVGCFTNCRESGLTFRISEKKAFTWCVYEHRNSDMIIVNGKNGYISMNGDLPYKSDDKYSYIKAFNADEEAKVADFLASEFIKFYDENKFD